MTTIEFESTEPCQVIENASPGPGPEAAFNWHAATFSDRMCFVTWEDALTEIFVNPISGCIINSDWGPWNFDVLMPSPASYNTEIYPHIAGDDQYLYWLDSHLPTESSPNDYGQIVLRRIDLDGAISTLAVVHSGTDTHENWPGTRQTLQYQYRDVMCAGPNYADQPYIYVMLHDKTTGDDSYRLQVRRVHKDSGDVVTVLDFITSELIIYYTICETYNGGFALTGRDPNSPFGLATIVRFYDFEGNFVNDAWSLSDFGFKPDACCAFRDGILLGGADIYYFDEESRVLPSVWHARPSSTAATIPLQFGGIDHDILFNEQDPIFIGLPFQLHVFGTKIIYLPHAYGSANTAVFMGTPSDAALVVPPLRQRQRDDAWRTPRMAGPVANHPTSRQYSLRQGNRNSYW